MTLEIIKHIDNQTRERYEFKVFDLVAVFTFYSKDVKYQNKRKWTVEEFWDKYNHRNCNMQEPELPEIIRSEALGKLQMLCRVATWNEYKSL